MTTTDTTDIKRDAILWAANARRAIARNWGHYPAAIAMADAARTRYIRARSRPWYEAADATACEDPDASRRFITSARLEEKWAAEELDAAIAAIA